MSRKPQLVNYIIEQALVKQQHNHNKRHDVALNVFDRAAMISPLALGRVFRIHNGRTFIPLQVDMNHIGYKFGAFALTRKRIISKRKKTKAKKAKKK